MTNKIAILILAAGAASRMGSIKQLLPWNGEPLLAHILKTAMSSAAHSTTLITGANAETIIKGVAIPGEVHLVNNEYWAKGLGSSIKSGLNHLMATDMDVNAVLILLADQPLIDKEYLDKLIAKYNQGNFGIVATAYKSGPGVPAIFDGGYFDKLSKLAMDKGAKSIIKENLSDTLVLEPLGKERDIDTPADYSSLSKESGKRGN